MPLRTPSSFTAGRRVKLLGSTYQPGATVPNSVVKQVKKLSALLSARILVPNVKLRESRDGRTRVPGPSDINPKMRKNL